MLHLKVKETIKNSGLSATKNRISVLKLFIKLNKAIKLSDIKLAVKNIDRVTLFRILNTFSEKKIIHKIVLNNGSILYALCNSSCSSKGQHIDDHIHFECSECEDVICLNIPNYPTIDVPNFLFYNFNINATGICDNCNQSN